MNVSERIAKTRPRVVYVRYFPDLTMILPIFCYLDTYVYKLECQQDLLMNGQIYL